MVNILWGADPAPHPPAHSKWSFSGLSGRFRSSSGKGSTQSTVSGRPRLSATLSRVHMTTGGHESYGRLSDLQLKHNT